MTGSDSSIVVRILKDLSFELINERNRSRVILDSLLDGISSLGLDTSIGDVAYRREEDASCKTGNHLGKEKTD